MELVELGHLIRPVEGDAEGIQDVAADQHIRFIGMTEYVEDDGADIRNQEPNLTDVERVCGAADSFREKLSNGCNGQLLKVCERNDGHVRAGVEVRGHG